MPVITELYESFVSTCALFFLFLRFDSTEQIQMERRNSADRNSQGELPAQVKPYSDQKSVHFIRDVSYVINCNVLNVMMKYCSNSTLKVN